MELDKSDSDEDVNDAFRKAQELGTTRVQAGRRSGGDAMDGETSSVESDAASVEPDEIASSSDEAALQDVVDELAKQRV
jgi:hypothetical protein